MGISNFWFYTIMIVVILHIIVAFVFLLYKLSFGTSIEKPEPVALAIHFIPVCILAVFLIISTINSSNQIFIEKTDIKVY